LRFNKSPSLRISIPNQLSLLVRKKLN